MSGLERIPKTGAYRYRRGIPVHLRAYFPDKGTVWREHLNTKVEHEARVCFYERSGFALAPRDAIAPLLQTYWNVPDRQIETSVVLASPALSTANALRLIADA